MAAPLPFLPTSPASAGAAVVEYLPTAEQRDGYEVVEVERVVVAQPPPQPPKNPAVTRVEVRQYHVLLHHSVYDIACIVSCRICSTRSCWCFVMD